MVLLGHHIPSLAKLNLWKPFSLRLVPFLHLQIMCPPSITFLLGMATLYPLEKTLLLSFGENPFLLKSHISE